MRTIHCKKIRRDFKASDVEWNNNNTLDISTDPNLIFKTLEEQSQRLQVLREQCGKDELQILPKWQYILPMDYKYIFTFLNTNEETNKSFKE